MASTPTNSVCKYASNRVSLVDVYPCYDYLYSYSYPLLLLVIHLCVTQLALPKVEHLLDCRFLMAKKRKKNSLRWERKGEKKKGG